MRNDDGQLHLIEVITVAVIIFTAIALSSVFRLPVAPGTFQANELSQIGNDALRFLANTLPLETDDCNEAGFTCPFADQSELERLLSLAVGYVGPNPPAVEIADRGPLVDFLDQAIPDGVQYVVLYSNAVNATKVAPLARNPPLLDVSVARTLVAPNWTVFAAQADNSVLVRIGETAAFGSPTVVRDPLNREQTEFGYALTSLYADQVPNNASLGTHEICYGATCRYFTVTPPGIFGAGSQILPGDRDNSSAVRRLGASGDFYAWTKYNDTDSDGFHVHDPLYIDVDSNNVASQGDVRLARVSSCRGGEPCAGGSFVLSTDSDAGRVLTALPATGGVLRGADPNGNDNLDEGEAVYWADDVNTVLDVDEWRMSRAGIHAMGTLVASGDSDQASNPPLPATLLFGGAAIWFDDANGNSNLDLDEAVYLDLDGLGLESGDFHITPKGEPTTRYFYEVRLVVWFGI